MKFNKFFLVVLLSIISTYSWSVLPSDNYRLIPGLFSFQKMLTCSGSVIYHTYTNSYYYATASHCFPKGLINSEFKIYRFEENGEKIPDSLIKVTPENSIHDPSHDVVLFKLESNIYNAKKVSLNRPNKGQHVFVVGAPAELGNIPYTFSCVYYGIGMQPTTHPRVFNKKAHIIECDDIVPGVKLGGISGGAVYNEKDEVVGVLSGGLHLPMKNGKLGLFFNEITDNTTEWKINQSRLKVNAKLTNDEIIVFPEKN